MKTNRPRRRDLAPNDPARGFIYEQVPHVSAATLAYDLPARMIDLVDRPLRKKGVVRLASPFTVESESPDRYLAPGDPRQHAQQIDADLARAVVAALTTAGVCPPGGGKRIRFDSLEPHPAPAFVSLTGETSTGERVAVALYPDDIFVGGHLLARSAEAAAGIAGVETLLAVAFAFAADSGAVADPPVKVLRAQANRDLMIGNLAPGRQDAAFVLVAEPVIEIAPAPRPPDYFTVAVRGYLVFDPATGNLREGAGRDIACWMLDTDYDGQCFAPSRIHFPGAGKDKQLLRLRRSLGRRLNRDAWAAMLTLKSTPFPRPETGRICVRLITHAGAEMTAVEAV